MKIRKIKIENVRGILEREISADIHPNTPTFFVAPNGFGKTSIATAFKSANRDRINVSEEDKYKNDPESVASIEITDEENVYVVNSTTNTILSEYSMFVINSQVRPKASTRNIGAYTSSTPSLIVEPIILYKTIPNKKEFSYSLRNKKSEFGVSAGKLLINLKENLSDPTVVLKLEILKSSFDKLLQVTNERKMQAFINQLNDISGTAMQITESNINLEQITNIESFSIILNELDFLFSNNSMVEKIVNIIQFKEIYKENKSDIKNIFKYYNFIDDRNQINNMLSFFNCTWKNIRAVKKGSQFILEFPKANQISNGERDILCFIGKLFEARSKLNKKKCIIIIDEIFDYLDDANLIAAQYFITKFINQFKEDGRLLFPIILTHLDPIYFNTYSFSTKNVVYLEKATHITNKYKVNNLLKDRSNCKKRHKHVYDIISSKYLHFSVEEDFENEEVSQYLNELGLDAEINTPQKFKLKAYEELDSYKSGDDYDLALVCCGLRLAIEEMAFQQLSPQYHDFFLSTYKTVEKLSFAKERGANIPETHFLLSIIYNEAMHLDAQCQKLNPIAYKLKNKVIKHMISTI